MTEKRTPMFKINLIRDRSRIEPVYLKSPVTSDIKEKTKFTIKDKDSDFNSIAECSPLKCYQVAGKKI